MVSKTPQKVKNSQAGLASRAKGGKQSLYAWIAQAQRDSGKFKDGLPAIFWRKNRAPWLVCMTLVDWINLYQRNKAAENGKEVENDPQ